MTQENGKKMIAPQAINSAFDSWPKIAGVVSVPHNEVEYQGLVQVLDRLLDEVGENEGHPLVSLLEVVGVLVEKYEREHVPELKPK